MPPPPVPTPFLSTVLNPALPNAAPHPPPAQPSPATATASTSTPTSTPPRPPRHTRPTRAPAAPPPLTPLQRSLQARGKSIHMAPRDAEPYEARQRREHAATVLENAEMLMWYAGARNEGLSQTRQHFQNLVLGLQVPDRDVLWREEWEIPVQQRGEGAAASPARSGKGRDRDKERERKGKKRVSSAGV
ncbi:hypothetical protein BDV95DRAFT_541873 [Massariosphaeria phaeospora]|uniref:Uncharacterized protein n=1 Tax=Massariosphaeria phaeospora TaxID=100035 RepID=A0A7C8I862_9PLEO|nr:hypothetical protein BDV95DRAFT_541873 [Massariosphaeria phaeospora]